GHGGLRQARCPPCLHADAYASDFCSEASSLSPFGTVEVPRMMLCTMAIALESYSLNHGSLNALIGRPFLYCSRSSFRSTHLSYDWTMSGCSYISGYALSSPAMRHHWRCTYQSPLRLPPRNFANFHASSSTFVLALITYHSVNMCV